MPGFDDIQDPATAGGAFAGAVGPSLAGISPTLSSIVIDVGKKKKTPGQKMLGGREGEVVSIPENETPDLVSLDKALLHVYEMDESELSKIQKQMWDGGWYSNTTYKDGYTAGIIQAGDDVDRSWNAVVMTSARSGKSIQEVLQESIDKVNAAGGLDAIGKGRAAGGAEIRPTAKVDLYHYGNAIARSLVGREMSRDQMNKFIKEYQSQEIGGEAGSPQAAAEAFLQTESPGEVGAMRMVDGFDKLMEMVGGVRAMKVTE